MALAAEPEQGDLVGRVVDLIRSSGRADESLNRFAQVFLSQPAESDLEGYADETLAALAISASEFAANRTPGKHKIRALNPDGLVTPQGDVTIIEIINDDMPFLVDSVMGEILERGLDVHFVAHPIFQLLRDQTGALHSLIGAGEEGPSGSGKESYIHVHLERIWDEAQIEDLTTALSGILDDVRTVVGDWKPMLERLNRSVAAYTNAPPPVPVSDLAESIQFLKWLADNHFTFLGMRVLAFVGGAEEGQLEPVDGSGLGILRDPDVRVLKRGDKLVNMTPEIRNFFLAPAPVIVTKSNVRSRVHRRIHMDYIGVKIYGEEGEISGELRIVGLFTSAAYTRSVKNIPFLRHKADLIVRRSGYMPESHSGKALLNVLETFPRDELFQIDIHRLYDVAMGIQALELKPTVRVFSRIDEFDRFVSVMVYVPRDRFSTEVRRRISEFLAETYNGRVSAFYPFFPDGPLVRLHIIIGRYEGKTPERSTAFLNDNVAQIVRTWADRLKDQLFDNIQGSDANLLTEKYLSAFSAGYQETFSPDRAIKDIVRFEGLKEERPVAIDFYRADQERCARARVALYHLHGPIPLSRRVPILENLGFAVIDERSYRVRPSADGAASQVSLHDMVLETSDGIDIDLATHGDRLEEAFLAVWHMAAANDPYNRLVLKIGLDWREAAAIRAYGSYLRQIRSPFGQLYLSDTLVRHESVTRKLMELFRVRLDPALEQSVEERAAGEVRIAESIEAELEDIPSLDEDRIIRHFLNLIRSTLRTNFYCKGAEGGPYPTIAFKFNSGQIEGAPEPRPFAEIFVYSPRVEGIHLRGGRIARGGLRWSDRHQDFRTEVLGLAKAQQVKNTVIVPTGAKGGFVPKLLPADGSREEVLEEGVAAYKLFIASLLSVTDNLDGDIVPPVDVVRHDGDDPYLVVAADKGTAALSDTANEISTSHGFWLGDAFASGGSAGYDHKKMAITARGAWEAVKRHFREMDIDIQTTPFNVIGVGDMSGDVFGNGMLLSKQIRLLVAFDHRDIFIDPDPDPETSWNERKRLFDLPRSSWRDYDEKLISEGGGVFSRTSKAIPLSPQMQALSGLDKAKVTPNELIRGLLKSEADLLWFGGIGTYVKAADETDDEVGDRATDALRVTADELRVKVVGEGANLGMTQRARIGFAMKGGRVNTDAIDNSAGVNSSDLEVNIKIALGQAMATEKLDLKARNKLLVKMTEQVAEACLRNNYLQTLAISLGQRRRLADLGFQERLMRELEQTGLLDREIEFLPSDMDLVERQKLNEPLTRPELAVLLAYAKIELYNDLVASNVPDEPYFLEELNAYFPETLRKKFPKQIESHRLRREIIATQLSNAIINRGGSTMFVRLKEETGHSADKIALAFTMAKAVFELDPLYDQIDALDNKVSGWFQLDLYLKVQDLLRRQTAWFLRTASLGQGLSETIDLYRSGVRSIVGALDKVLTDDQRTRLAEDQAALEQGGLSAPLAQSLARLSVLTVAPDIISVCEARGRPVEEIAHLFYEAATFFRLDALRLAGEKLLISDYFDRLAINSTMVALSRAQRRVAEDVVGLAGDGPAAFEAWYEHNRDDVDRARGALSEILDGDELSLSRLTVSVTYVRDLVPG